MECLQYKWGTILLATMFLAGCEKPVEQIIATPAQVSIMAVTATKLELTDELPGRVVAVRTAEIRSQVTGILLRRLFEQGSEIKAGHPLFQINAAPFKADADMAAAALQRTEIARSRAQVQVERLAPLMLAEAVSRQVYDDAVSQRDLAIADVAQAKATLARRQLDLSFSSVDAPISGRIDQTLISEGALVGPTDTNPLARIQQIDHVYVDVRQPASNLEALRTLLTTGKTDSRNLPATILRGSGDVYTVNGKILFSGINVEAGTGDVLLRILVDNSRRDLLPGMFVRARVPRSIYPDALMVPQQAVVRTGDEGRLWLVDDQNKVHAATVRLGELVGRHYRVAEGLIAGQKIVVEGMERLSEGAEVKTNPWNSSATPPRINQR